MGGGRRSTDKSRPRSRRPRRSGRPNSDPSLTATNRLACRTPSTSAFTQMKVHPPCFLVCLRRLIAPRPPSPGLVRAVDQAPLSPHSIPSFYSVGLGTMLRYSRSWSRIRERGRRRSRRRRWGKGGGRESSRTRSCRMRSRGRREGNGTTRLLGGPNTMRRMKSRQQIYERGQSTRSSRQRLLKPLDPLPRPFDLSAPSPRPPPPLVVASHSPSSSPRPIRSPSPVLPLTDPVPFRHEASQLPTCTAFSSQRPSLDGGDGEDLSKSWWRSASVSEEKGRRGG